VIDDLYSCGAKTINIVGAGEPTIDPYFEDVIKYISKKGMVTVLFTNGIKLASKSELVGFLYDHNVSPILKYNSISNDVQDLVAGQKGYAKKRNAALEMLIAKGFNKGEPTRLGIDMMAFRGNWEELPKIHQWCRENNIFPIAGDYIPTGRTDNGIFEGIKALNAFDSASLQKTINLLQPISGKQRLELLNKLDSIDNKYGISRAGCFSYFGGAKCTQILGLYIDIEGNIWPCIARKKKLNGHLQNGLMGNVRERIKPSEIWRYNNYLKHLRANYNGGCPYKPTLQQEALMF